MGCAWFMLPPIYWLHHSFFYYHDTDSDFLKLQRWDFHCKLGTSSKKWKMQQFYLKKTHQQLKIQNMKRNVFIIYSPRHIKIEPASFRRVDTEIFGFFLPQKSRGFITSRFNGNKSKEVFDGEHRLWIEILNRSFVDNIVIKKTTLLISL